MEERTCAQCGTSIEGLPPQSRYCTLQCREAAKWVRRPRAACVYCGEATGWAVDDPRAEGATHPACRPVVHGTVSAYRQRKCRCAACREAWNASCRVIQARVRERARRAGVKRAYRSYGLECEQCESGFESTSKRARFCSVQCAGAARRKVSSTDLVLWEPKPAPPVPITVVAQPKWWAVIVSGPCSWCGEDFTATGSSARYCSKRCQKTAAQSGRGRFVVPPRRRLALYDRDGWTCRLCGDPVDRSLTMPDPWAPTLDHIVPRSLGGSDDDENLRLAHAWCNSVRGAGVNDDLFEEVV